MSYIFLLDGFERLDGLRGSISRSQLMPTARAFQIGFVYAHRLEPLSSINFYHAAYVVSLFLTRALNFYRCVPDSDECQR